MKENQPLPEAPNYRHVYTFSPKLLYGPGGPFDRSEPNDSSRIRNNNRKAIDHLLFERGELTKQDISTALSLSLPTVTDILADMLLEGKLEICRARSTGVGRPPAKYRIVEGTHIYIALLLDGNEYDILAADFFGNELLREHVRREYSDDSSYWEALAADLEARLGAHGMRVKNSIGVNFVFNCKAEPVSRRVEGIWGYPCTAFDAEWMSERLGAPLYVNPILDAAAFYLASTTECGNAFGLSVSNLVCSATVVGGRIFRTEHSEAGQTSHFILVPDGKKCVCGKRGCAFAYCSTSVFEEDWGESVTEFIGKLSHGTAREVYWHDYLSKLAIYISNQYYNFHIPVFLTGTLADCLGEDFKLLEELVYENLDRNMRQLGETVLYLAPDVKTLALKGGIGIISFNYLNN